MNYFALFLNKNSYVEKCLSLIRFIGNPETSSFPHITLRLFKPSNTRLEYIREAKISFLNIIEPGAFNINEEKTPFIVFIRCESDELEEIEYKPDYPFSRLHITLYEGNDLFYAKNLFSLLNERSWHFKLSFEEARYLTERKLGSKIFVADYFQKIYEEIIDDDFDNFKKRCSDNNYKLDLVKIVLEALYKYLKQHEGKTKQINSIYAKSDAELFKNSNKFLDESKNNIKYKTNQLSFDSVFSEIAQIVSKPVQDAIYVTPPEYARDMAKCALKAFGDDSKKIDFGDSAIGTGALFLALKHVVDDFKTEKNNNYEFNSAIGIDIDEEMAKEAFIRCSIRGLTVIYGDAISPNIDLISCRNLMIVNPPYNRYEDIPKEYRAQVQKLAEKQTGIKVLGDAGLYVYHLLIMDKWLCEGGVAVWLLPSIFLQTRYGEAIRQYLLNNVELINLHIYDDTQLQFENTFVSTTIVTFRKKMPESKTNIEVSFGDSYAKPIFNRVINRDHLIEAAGNWRQVISRSYKDNHFITTNVNQIKFEDIFNIKRGLATGANSFFVMERSEADNLGIPDFALKPLLPKARYLSSVIVDSKNDGYPDVNPQLVLIDCEIDEVIIKNSYPLFFEYLEIAKKKQDGSKSIVERTLVKARKPWYKQEKREPPPFLLTYMGRKKKNESPLYFIWNKSKAIALNTYLLLYPKEWLMTLLNENEYLYVAILNSLNQSSKRIISQRTRVYSGGLQKLEPGELKGLPIVELPDEVIKAFRKNVRISKNTNNTD